MTALKAFSSVGMGRARWILLGAAVLIGGYTPNSLRIRENFLAFCG